MDIPSTGGSGFFYNITLVEDSRIILFMGKNGSFLSTKGDKAIYISGYTGNKYNTRLATFEPNIKEQFKLTNDIFAQTEKQHKCAKHLGRQGHIAFWYNKLKQVVLFGGFNIS